MQSGEFDFMSNSFLFDFDFDFRWLGLVKMIKGHEKIEL